MTFDEFKKVFASHGFVKWNGEKYKASGIKCVRVHGELINSVMIESVRSRANYWVDAREVNKVI